MKSRRLLILTFVLIFAFQALTAHSLVAAQKPDQLKDVDIIEHLGEEISPQSFTFTDEEGQSAPLSKFFQKDHPVILVLAYFRCPQLCNMILNGLVDSLRKLDWTAGQEFEVVVVSIDPNETPALAKKKKATYLKSYNRFNSENGWHFLTGEESQIHSLASRIGFKYQYDEKENQYLHASAIFVLTPQGKISRYLYGISYPMKDLRFSLMDASVGKVGTMMDKILLFCFHFDPSRNSYTLRMWRIVQLIFTVQALALIAGLIYLHRKKPIRATPDQTKGV